MDYPTEYVPTYLSLVNPLTPLANRWLPYQEAVCLPTEIAPDIRQRMQPHDLGHKGLPLPRFPSRQPFSARQ